MAIDRAGGSGEQIRAWGSALRWVTLGLVVLAAWVVSPLWPALILAAWFALLAVPLHGRVSEWVRGPRLAAGLLTGLLALLLLAPLVLLGVSLAPAAVELGGRVASSEDFDKVLSALVGEGHVQKEIGSFSIERVVGALRQNVTMAISNAGKMASGLLAGAVALAVFFYAFYYGLVDGRRAAQWAVTSSPLSPSTTRRLMAAFEETGRGLLIGTGLTAVIQGAIATIGYVIVGLPHALPLGFLTLIAALLPSIGTGIVWVPVAGALFLRGDNGAAIGIVVVGLIASTADNFIRPALSRYGKLEMPAFFLFVTMLSGVAVFGAAGLLYGPLIFRLTKEALDVIRDRRIEERARAVPTAREEAAPEGGDTLARVT